MEPEEEGAVGVAGAVGSSSGGSGVAEFNVAALTQVTDANPYCTLANFDIEKKIGQGQV